MVYKYFRLLPDDLPEDYYFKEDEIGNIYLCTRVKMKGLKREMIVMRFRKESLQAKWIFHKLEENIIKLKHKFNRNQKIIRL